MTPEIAPPCLECGACCFSKLATFVRVDGFDHARLGERRDELTAFVGNRCHMTMLDGHCAALVVDAQNQVWTSKSLEGKLQRTAAPTDGL